jgi:hypothetical protein
MMPRFQRRQPSLKLAISPWHYLAALAILARHAVKLSIAISWLATFAVGDSARPQQLDAAGSFRLMAVFSPEATPAPMRGGRSSCMPTPIIGLRKERLTLMTNVLC